MSRKSGSEVKESIVLLCRMFKCSGICQSILPDHIRQAKFDKPDVVSVLLHLLTALVLDTDDEKTTSADLKNVLKRLGSCRYPRTHYLVDESGKWSSSREILLAIAWFMTCDGTLDRMRDEAMRHPDVVANMLHKTRQNETPLNSTSFAQHARTLTVTEKSSHMNWAVSQINNMVMQIKSLEEAIAKKEYQVTMKARTEFQEDPSLLFLLRHESLCAEYERQLEKKVLLLQAYLRWKEVEHVFWLWMDSVLAAAVQAAATPRKSDIRECTTTYRPPLEDMFRKEINLLHQELQVHKKCHQESLNEKIDMLAAFQPEHKAEIDREMELIRRRLEDDQARPVLLHSPDGNESARLHHVQTTLRKTVPLSFELERLQNMNFDLEKELEELRLHSNETLTKFSQRFPGVVMIPPLTLKAKRRK